jgi:hypothetical protein
MTLPVAFPISLQQIANELGFSLPLSMDNQFVIELAGKSVGPVSLSDLFGKTGNFSGSMVSGGAGTRAEIDFPSPTFFGGTIASLQEITAGLALSLNFSVAPNLTGNIVVKNTTTGASSIFTKSSSTLWSGQGPIIRTPVGYNDNYTVYPSE